MLNRVLLAALLASLLVTTHGAAEGLLRDEQRPNGPGGGVLIYEAAGLGPQAAGQGDSLKKPGRPETRLPSIKVSGKTPCEVHPETAEATADLWLAARETLESASRTPQDAPTLLIREWRRSLDGRHRLRWERSDTSFVRTLHPFEKPMPGNLERAGYIQQRGWTTFFYGPDAGLLISEWFLRRHCFSRITGSGGSAGLVGLAFEPPASTERTDVAGVLWIDPDRHELRHVEYAWTRAPAEARGRGVGGRADFARLKSGGWIIQRWNIRMPRLEAGLGNGFDGYTDQGGEVLAVSEGKPRRN
jgi:hypothetical protein